MTTLTKLVERGIAETRLELVSVFQNVETGALRFDLWSQPGIPSADAEETEIGRFDGRVTCVYLHWGRWVLAAEEEARVTVAAVYLAAVRRPDTHFKCPVCGGDDLVGRDGAYFTCREHNQVAILVANGKEVVYPDGTPIYHRPKLGGA